MTRNSLISALVLALAPAVIISGCNVQKNLWKAGIPGVTTSMTVEAVHPRDFALEVRLGGDDFGLDTYVPADALCRRLLPAGQEVSYVPNAVHGRFRVGDEQCDAIGIGSLRAWRDRRGRVPTDTPIPRAQATYREVYRDGDVVFLRGIFPLASWVGWAGGGDTIAVIPNSEMCQPPAERRASSMEFRQRGATVLSLVSSNGLCEIVGLIRPPSQTQGAPEADGGAAPPASS